MQKFNHSIIEPNFLNLNNYSCTKMKTITNPAAFKTLMATGVFLFYLFTPLFAFQYDDSLLIEQSHSVTT